ncbi:MAG TPA: glycoside hydrolase family 57 protein [Cyclobacteriaceae bacterium]|nr:glycoside hydrolase family 57 protein [Cyclobacteriaceae bacterium]
MKSAKTKQPVKPLVLYFHVHQPRRLRRFGFLDIGDGHNYFNDSLNADIIQRTAQRCYLPVNDMLTNLCKALGNVRLTYSISGVVLGQFEKFAPEVIHSFQSLVNTGCVELLAETSHHSLASLMPNEEFPHQIEEHLNLIERHFHTRPTVFRNTELIYNNNIGARVAQLGFKGIICDDVDRVLMHNDHHAIYHHPSHRDFKILLRNNVLSDDIGFRFITGTGKLDLDRYFRSIESSIGVTTLAFDYETFGEHVPETAGIIDFLHDFIEKASRSNRVKLMTPTDVFSSVQANDKLDVPDFISWADEHKDLSAWLENDIQNEAFKMMQGLEEQVMKVNNPELTDTWRNLQTSDHFYYMSTKTAGDGEVHSYFSPYNSPYEAYINYMNILNDFKLKLQAAPPQNHTETTEHERRHEHTPNWAERAQADYHELTSR